MPSYHVTEKILRSSGPGMNAGLVLADSQPQQTGPSFDMLHQ